MANPSSVYEMEYLKYKMKYLQLKAQIAGDKPNTEVNCRTYDGNDVKCLINGCKPFTEMVNGVEIKRCLHRSTPLQSKGNPLKQEPSKLLPSRFNMPGNLPTSVTNPLPIPNRLAQSRITPSAGKLTIPNKFTK